MHRYKCLTSRLAPKTSAIVAAAVLVVTVFMMTLAAQPAAARTGGPLPLTDIMALAKPYPNLLLEIRLQLIRAGLKKDSVSCSATRLGSDWGKLTGTATAPYSCVIGKRTLKLTSTQIFYDKVGRRLDNRHKDTSGRASKVTEVQFVWRWQ